MFVVHAYHTIDVDILWATAIEDVPELDDRLSAMEEAERDRS